jgi:3-hydroxyacyl-[acyl-carrier-protein] dehydratase
MIRVGQEKAAIAEEITLTFGYAEAVMPPPVAEVVAQKDAKSPASAPVVPLRVAINA